MNKPTSFFFYQHKQAKKIYTLKKSVGILLFLQKIREKDIIFIKKIHTPFIFFMTENDIFFLKKKNWFNL